MIGFSRLGGGFVALALVVFLVSGCALSGMFGGGSGDTAQRFLADIGCVTALAGAAVQVAGDPAVGGAKTALDVASAIAKVGASNVPSSALSACADTLRYAKEDMAGFIAMVKGAKGSEAQVAPAPAAQRAPLVFQPQRVTPVQVPIR